MPDVHCTPLPNLWGLPLSNSQSKHFGDKRYSLAESTPSSPTGFSSASSTTSDHRRSQLSSAGASPPTPSAHVQASMRQPSKVLPKVNTSPALFPNSKESIWWPASGSSSSSVSQSASAVSSNNATPYNMLFNGQQTNARTNISGFTSSRGAAPMRPPGVDDVLISPASPPMVAPIGYGPSNGPVFNGPASSTGFNPFQQQNSGTIQFNRGLGIEGNAVQQTVTTPMLQRHQSLPLHQPQPSHFVYYDVNPLDEHNGYLSRRTPMAVATTVPSSPSRNEAFDSNTTILSSQRGSIVSAASSTTSIVSVDKGLLTSPSSATATLSSQRGLSSQRSSTSSSSSMTQKRKGNAKNIINTDLYKTELCSSYMTSGGNCPYGAKCQFAHGEKELKIVDRPPKWRSKPCQNWIKNGMCSYNDRCCFRHDM